MNTPVSAALMAAALLSGGTGIALAQTTTPPPAADMPADKTADADMTSQAAVRPKTGMEARMSGVSAGTVVQSPAGESLGTVKDIVPNANSGRPDFVLISTRSGETAVPYATVAPLFHDGHIVLDRSRLEAAPRVSESQLQDQDRAGADWKKQANRYWETGNPAVLR